MENLPTTDDGAIARIRALGRRPEVTETMARLFRVKHALGKGLVEAFKETLLASLSNETLRSVGTPDCQRVLAERQERRA